MSTQSGISAPVPGRAPMRSGTAVEFIRSCMVSFYFYPEYSGSAVQARNLGRHLVLRGIEPFIVSANLSRIESESDVGGLHVYRLPVVLAKSAQIPSFWLSLALFLIRHRRRFDLVHAHGTLQHGVASVVARLLGKKSVLKVAMANSDIAFDRQGRLWGRLNRFFVSCFDHYIATSKDVYQEFLNSGMDADRISLIPNGVDTDVYRPVASAEERQRLRANLGLPNGPIVCFVGIINERKNIDFILRTWRRVKQRGADGHLLLIGPTPEQQDTVFYRKLRQYVTENGLADSVTFTGHREAVHDYLRAADVFFFPSKQEGMPNVLLEAMACGLPCVVSRISGTEDLIRHNDNGFIFPLSDEESFTEALVDVLHNKVLAARLGSNARRFIEERFALGAIAEKYELLYRKLLGLG